MSSLGSLYVRVRALDEFRIVQTITSLRLGLSVRGYRLAVRLMMAVGGSLALVFLGLVLVTTRAVLTDTGELSAFAVLAAVTVLAVCAAYAYEEMTGTRRFAVCHSPSAALFRALDIPVLHVLVVFRLRAITYFYLGVTVLAGMLGWTVLSPLGARVAPVILVVPVAWWLTTVGLATHFASRPLVGRRRMLVVVGPAALVGLVAGYLGTRALVQPLVEDGFATAFDPYDVTRVLIAVAIASGTAAIAGIILGLRAFVVLRRCPFAPVHEPRAERAASGTGLRWGLYGVLYREWSRTWAFRLALRAFAVAAAVVAACSAALVAGASFLPLDVRSLGPWSIDADSLHVTLSFATTGLALGIVSLAQSKVGPTVYARQLRLLWELGASRWWITACVLALFLLPAMAIGIGGTAVSAALLGRTDLLPIAGAVGVACASLIADYVSNPPLNTDGTVVEDDALSTLLLIVASTPVVYFVYQRASLGAMCCSILLTGVAALCVSHRIRRLPFHSWTSPWATEGASPSCATSP